MTLTVRPVAPGDATLVRSLFLAAHGDLDGLPVGLVDMQIRAQRHDYAARFPEAVESIVVHDGHAVGRLWVHRDAYHWRLLDVALLAQNRGSGLGTKLLRGLIADAAAAGVSLRLTVARENAAARRLYTRLGFESISDEGPWIVMERSCHSSASRRAMG